MKIKLLPGIEYEDIDPNRVYEVISERVWSYIVLDDDADENAILKEDCEIVYSVLEEKPMKEFKVGDRVKVTDNNMDKLFDWHVEHKVNSTGVVEEDATEPNIVVLLEDDNMMWSIPKECLEIVDDCANKQIAPCDLQQILNFTRDMKGFEVSFEEGKVTVKDWDIDYDCVEYVLDSIDDLEPMMESISYIQSFKKK